MYYVIRTDIGNATDKFGKERRFELKLQAEHWLSRGPHSGHDLYFISNNPRVQVRQPQGPRAFIRTWLGL